MSGQIYFVEFEMWFYKTYGRQFYEHNENDNKILEAYMAGLNNGFYKPAIITPENSYHEP